MNAMTMKQRKARKGFSLVELVVVILIIAILAVAVFAGGSVVIKKSQVSRTTSDLHNFSVAVESTLNEHPEVANVTATSTVTLANIEKALNENLPADYQLQAVDLTGLANITKTDSTDSTYAIFQSTKTDAWDNPYFVILDCNERNSSTESQFFITVISAGPNAKANIGGAVDADDIFLLAQYESGDVTAVTYNAATVTPAFSTNYAGSGSTLKNF